MKPMSEPLLESLDALINQARRTWEDLSVDREKVYGVLSATYDQDCKLVVMRVKNTDDEDALVAVNVDEYLLFALRLLNKRYEGRLSATLTTKGMN